MENIPLDHNVKIESLDATYKLNAVERTEWFLFQFQSTQRIPCKYISLDLSVTQTKSIYRKTK